MAFVRTRNGAWYALFVLLSCTPLQAQGPDLGDPPAAPASRPFLPRNSAVPNATAPNWYDIANRTIVRDSWNLTFALTLSVPMGWSGDVALGNAGTTAQAFKDAVATRINWFRAMAGVPTGTTLDPAYSSQDQQAAMMFSVNRQISHTPPSSWINYSAAGAAAAGNSNICLGYTSDPGCVLAYIVDQGSNNAAAGHRRWILYPQTQVMGTGDVPQSGGGSNPYPPANALWVFDGNYGSTRPGTRDTYVAWPPPGFVPYQVVGPRWSFSYPNADFAGAAVSMQRNGAPVSVRLETIANGYGENTLVWVPDNLDASNNGWRGVAPASDTTSTVTIANVLISGVARTFTYGVTVFDPAAAPVGTFSFNPSSGTVPYTGGPGTANLTVSPFGTIWTASVAGSWLGITSGSSGNSSGPIAWSASANPSSFNRTATITAGAATYTLSQPGTPCVYGLNQFSGALPVGGGRGSFIVTAAPSDCAPSYSAAGFLTVNSSSAPGAITFNYSAGPNGAGVNRTATVTVGGQVTFTVTQSGLTCTFAIAPAGAPVTSAGATGSVTVTASASTCPWVASSNTSWITANSSATGNGTGSYTAAPNPTPLQRTGTLFIAGQAFVLTQQPPVGTDSEAFVRQLYVDILSRTADTAGLNTWVGWINSGQATRAQVASQFLQSAEFSVSGSYITKLYLAIMLRDPDYGGWTGWFSYLRSGHSQTEILNQFLGSQEFQLRYGSLDNTAFVTLVYNNVLNRAPDPAGLAQWVAWLNAGTYSRAEVMNGFITSPEFDSRARNRVYANMLYIGFLRRVGEPAGLDGWTNWLNAGTYTLEQVVGGFINSPEYLARF